MSDGLLRAHAHSILASDWLAHGSHWVSHANRVRRIAPSSFTAAGRAGAVWHGVGQHDGARAAP